MTGDCVPSLGTGTLCTAKDQRRNIQREQWVEQILESSHDSEEQAVCWGDITEIPTGGVKRLCGAGD